MFPCITIAFCMMLNSQASAYLASTDMIKLAWASISFCLCCSMLILETDLCPINLFTGRRKQTITSSDALLSNCTKNLSKHGTFSNCYWEDCFKGQYEMIIMVNITTLILGTKTKTKTNKVPCWLSTKLHFLLQRTSREGVAFTDLLSKMQNWKSCSDANTVKQTEMAVSLYIFY